MTLPRLSPARYEVLVIPFLFLVESPFSGAYSMEKNPGLASDEWYVRLIVEAPGESLADSGNVLGQLRGSRMGRDSRDLQEMGQVALSGPGGIALLNLVFPHPEWKNQAGDYASDYHAPTGKYVDHWEFLVRSDDPERKLTLRWDATAPSPLLRGSLQDLDTGKKFRLSRPACFKAIALP